MTESTDIPHFRATHESWSATLRHLVLFALVACCTPAHAQLRVVTYNTTKDGPHPGLSIVLQSIGEQSRNGIAKPIDVLLLQEQNGPFGDTQEIVTLLNGIYGPEKYAHGNTVGGTTDPKDRQTIVYNTATVSLVGELAFGNVGTISESNVQPRQTLRYRLRPVGYDSAADFYVYNSHTRADDGSMFEAQRLVEAKAIRANYNTLPAGSPAIYAGDFNFYRSIDDGFQWLTMAGSGQAIDPINRIGSWSAPSLGPSFADVHTQSPCAESDAICMGATGGMDDRFDFQLVTTELRDNEGLSYINGSYHAFGNNGSTYNQNINQRNASNQLVNSYSFNGVTSFTKTQILDALWTASDHLPVVADYQVPAVMQTVSSAIPGTVILGQEFNLEVSVFNMADVVIPLGADELDYSLITSGNLSGSFMNQVELALGDGNKHNVTLDTTTLGMKSGMITVASTSQAVHNGLINIPVSFLVVPLPGDYNQDGTVDAGDYTVWRDTLGQTVSNHQGADGSGDGIVDGGDYTIWRAHFGNSVDGPAIAAPLTDRAVPEPRSWLMLVVGACLMHLAGSTLRAWTHTS